MPNEFFPHNLPNDKTVSKTKIRFLVMTTVRSKVESHGKFVARLRITIKTSLNFQNIMRALNALQYLQLLRVEKNLKPPFTGHKLFL